MQRSSHVKKALVCLLVAAQAYVRDAVSPKEYEEACQNLISKFKTLQAALKDNGVPNVEAFMVRPIASLTSMRARFAAIAPPALSSASFRC